MATSRSGSAGIAQLIVAFCLVNDCFAALTERAPGAAPQYLKTFYRRMPTEPHPDTGDGFSRCDTWRTYMMMSADGAGDRVGRALFQRASYAQLRALLEKQGLLVGDW